MLLLASDLDGFEILRVAEAGLAEEINNNKKNVIRGSHTESRVKTKRKRGRDEGASLLLSEVLIHLGQRVRQLRKEKGWSQQKLAEVAALDRTYLSAVEHGKQNLTLGAVLKIAQALESSLASLLLPAP